MDDTLTATLKCWRTLNDQMYGMTEDDVKTMLDHEVATRKRVTFVERLHQRYCTLRTNRERMAIMEQCK
jgi:hypothetical protein